MLGGDKSSVLRASIDFITYKRLKGKVTIIDEIVESCCVVLDVLSFHHSSIRDEVRWCPLSSSVELLIVIVICLHRWYPVMYFPN
jgi:hypothetical protein